MVIIKVSQEFSRYLIFVKLNWEKYAHVCQGGRIEQMLAYALQYVTTFDTWLWEVYFLQQFPNYERYWARYIGFPPPKIRKQLPCS